MTQRAGEGTTRTERDVREFYEAEAADYDARRWRSPAGAATARVQAAIAREMLERMPPGPFLELGVGTGRFCADLCSAERPCVALDIAAAMLAATARRVAEAGKSEHVRLVRASALALPFAEGSLSACLSFNVFSHLPDAEATLAELSRALRPGGMLALNVPNAWSPYLPYAAAVKLLGTSLLRGVHTRWYSPPEIQRLLAAAGFRIVARWGQLHYPWAPGRLLPALLSPFDRAVRRGPLTGAASTLYVLAERLPT